MERDGMIVIEGKGFVEGTVHKIYKLRKYKKARV
jgi:hypothetical protein